MTAGAGSHGKRRRLAATATPEGHFAVLALDHIGSMAETMRPDDPTTVTRDQMATAKVEIAHRLGGLASAVLLDPIIGHTGDGQRPQLGDGTGLLLGIEDGDYASTGSPPRLIAGWSVERAARVGADAIKISFRFDPSGDTGEVEGFVADIAAECVRCDLPLFAEPLGVFGDPAERRGVIVEGARRFGQLGVDVLKLEFPEDVAAVTDRGVWAEACAALDAAAAVPWTLLSGGEDFTRFREMLEVACDAGASGFVAGRAVWREAVLGNRVDPAGADSSWTPVATQRMEQLAATTRERARPWTDQERRR